MRYCFIVSSMEHSNSTTCLIDTNSEMSIAYSQNQRKKILKCIQKVEKNLPVSNFLTFLQPWHPFPLDLTHACYSAKTGSVLSNLHAPPVSPGNPNLKEVRRGRENRTQVQHTDKQGRVEFVAKRKRIHWLYITQ